MGQKSSTPKGANKFQSPVEATNKHVGTFQSGIVNNKLKVSEIPARDDRGSGYVDTQFGLSREPVLGHKPSTAPRPEQHERDYFADNFITPNAYPQQESTSGDTSCVIGVSYDYDAAVNMYPRNARIIATLREACTRSLMLIPEQNIMIQATHEADFQYDAHVHVHDNGQNEGLLQDKPIIRVFVENMEPDVPKELVTFESN